nr:chitinase 1 [Quercus suber]
MTNQWVPNSDDVEANRVAGFGLTTNIIDGEVECGHGEIDSRDRTRFNFYLTFCDLLGVPIDAETRATDTLDCSNQ